MQIAKRNFKHHALKNKQTNTRVCVCVCVCVCARACLCWGWDGVGGFFNIFIKTENLNRKRTLNLPNIGKAKKLYKTTKQNGFNYRITFLRGCVVNLPKSFKIVDLHIFIVYF